MNTYDFDVTIYYGPGDGGEVVIPMEVTEEEERLLTQCAADGECTFDDSCPGLEDLYARISREAVGESNAISEADEDLDFEIEEDDATCEIYVPDDLYPEEE